MSAIECSPILALTLLLLIFYDPTAQAKRKEPCSEGKKEKKILVNWIAFFVLGSCKRNIE